MSRAQIEDRELTLEPEEIVEYGSRVSQPASTDEAHAGHSKQMHLENEHWDAAAWTGTILNEYHHLHKCESRKPTDARRSLNVRRSKTKLDARLEEFLREAAPDDRKTHEASRQKVLSITKDVKEQHDKKYPPKTLESERRLIDSVKSAYRSASETASEYAQILDVMVGQAPEYVALAYGAVKLLLVVQINNEEMKQNIEAWMDKIKSKFEMVDHLTCYFPSQRLVDAICRMYDAFQRFLAKALKFYTRSRLGHAIRALRKPWKLLEPIVDSIEVISADIRDIIVYSTHYTGQLNLDISRSVLVQVTRVANLMEENCVRFSKASDVQETSGLFRQSIEAKMEQHGRGDSPTIEGNPIAKENHKSTINEEQSLDDKLSSIFDDLAKFDEATAQQQRMTEQLPEMQAYRKTRRNVLKVDRVMEWLESETSQLLWIDGNQILQRQTFNASFVVPLLIFGESSFETCLVLRHFCGDCGSIRLSNFQTLMQSLLRQLLKQRPEVWKALAGHFTEEKARDISTLWNLFVMCIKEAKADCTFIVVDSIDFLVSDVTEDGIDSKEFIMKELNDLVKESNPLVKILLTVSLSQESQTAQLSSRSLALKTLSSAVTRRPQRSLSMHIMENDMALVPQKLSEIQEKRCKTIRFSQLSMLYPVNSTVYTYEQGHVRAFVISEISGMDPLPFGMYSPVILRTWAIEHDGKDFVRRFYDLKVSQFAGEVSIDQLRYVPSGYLPEEHLHRRRMIRRGRRYWELSSKVHFMEFMIDGIPNRIIIDQHLRPSQPTELQNMDVRLPLIPADDLRPLEALACPPQISAYCLQSNTWGDLDLESIKVPSFEEYAIEKLLLPTKETLLAAISQFQHPEYIPSDATLILLHGGPGVGKTTAALHSAEHIRRPLLEISIGDIIEAQSSMLASFRETIQHAERWKAVVLLENADLLFRESSRQLSTQDRLLVSMSKELEAFRGLAFLTTDRIGILSGHVLSRIDIPLEFPPLDHQTRIELWTRLLRDDNHESDIRRERMDQFLRGEEGCDEMNGWDVKNTLSTARKFAFQEGIGNEPISWTHWKQAVRLQVQLKTYMMEVFGGTAEQQARRASHRSLEHHR